MEDGDADNIDGNADVNGSNKSVESSFSVANDNEHDTDHDHKSMVSSSMSSSNKNKVWQKLAYNTVIPN
jgi:hypothetical protein